MVSLQSTFIIMNWESDNVKSGVTQFHPLQIVIVCYNTFPIKDFSKILEGYLDREEYRTV